MMEDEFGPMGFEVMQVSDSGYGFVDQTQTTRVSALEQATST